MDIPNQGCRAFQPQKCHPCRFFQRKDGPLRLYGAVYPRKAGVAGSLFEPSGIDLEFDPLAETFFANFPTFREVRVWSVQPPEPSQGPPIFLSLSCLASPFGFFEAIAIYFGEILLFLQVL